MSRDKFQLDLSDKVKELLKNADPNWNGDQYFDLLSKLANTFVVKNADYVGLDQPDCLKDFRMTEDSDITPIQQVLSRLKDKMSRLNNLCRADASVQVSDEMITDTMLDAVNYLLIGVMLAKEGIVGKNNSILFPKASDYSPMEPVCILEKKKVLQIYKQATGNVLTEVNEKVREIIFQLAARNGWESYYFSPTAYQQCILIRSTVCK